MMNRKELLPILIAHEAWVTSNGGKRAGLRGADLRGADLRGASLRDGNLEYANMQSANLQNADLQGASLRYADLRGAILGKTELQGAFLDDTDFRGAKIFGKTIIDILRRVTRSDGYEFFLWHCEEGFFIEAGCHFFTWDQASNYWTRTRGGTPLGDETLDILFFFEAAIVRQRGEK
jgi:hypothetical protein